ncbi:hypothetical protein DL96DRAFT_1635754, partial [Flagelloscypha sp. PMI_526]
MSFLFSYLCKTKCKVFKSPKFVPDHWLAEEEATSKASSPAPVAKLPSTKKAKKDVGPVVMGEFDPAVQNAIVKRGKAAVANNLEHGAPSLETLRSVEAEAKAEVANLTFRISHYLFLRDQALKAVQRAADCLAHREKTIAYDGPDSEAMNLDE